MITAVFFDLYNTLAGFRPSRYEIQSEALADFGITVTPDGILRGYHLADAFMSAQNATKPVRSLDRDEQRAFFTEYERLVLSGAGVEVSPEQSWQIWRRIRKIDYKLTLFDDAIPALTACRQMGLTVGMISNINMLGDELADGMGLLPHLDFSITAQEVGAEKPNPLIFERALELAGADAASAVHVGDQIAPDIDGALNVGMRAILVDRDGNHADYTDHPRITDMTTLPDLLRRMSD